MNMFRALLFAGFLLFPAASAAQDAKPASAKQMRIVVASVGGTGPDLLPA